MTAHLLTVAITVPDDLAPAEAERLATMVERLGFTPLHDAELPAEGVVRANDPARVAEARAAVGQEGQVLVAVPIAVGRTLSEAMARADLEPRFTGDHHPEKSGIFGAFEDAQDQVLALANAGADGLVLEVPLERDVADVLAQIRALVAGAAPRLRGVDPGTRSEVAPTVFYGEGWTKPQGYDEP
jgi:hypothetical protein